MKSLCYIFILLFSANHVSAQKTVAVNFINSIHGTVLLPDSMYTNDLGEGFTISKLRYYISGLRFVTAAQKTFSKEIYLVDFKKTNSFHISVPKGKIIGLMFRVGVDSALNTSGAQTGALDPLNDMFWTWNSGYVTFKLEGESDAANTDKHRIEHHIGGFAGPYKTIRTVYLPVAIESKKSLSFVEVEMDLNKYWNGINKILIGQVPVVTTSGAVASSLADNFPGMFSIKVIH